MFCQQCGAQIEDGLAFCTACGTKQIEVKKEPEQVNNAYNQAQGQQQYQQPVYNNQYGQPNGQFQQGYAQGYQQPNQYAYNVNPTPKSVSFGEAIRLFFVNYVNFTGRSTRSEYWWAVLFNFLVSMVLSFIPYVGSVLSLAFIIPGLSLCIRRLHDIGKSWVWYLMGLIPLAGFIILIVYFCKESDGDNKWGPAPRG